MAKKKAEKEARARGIIVSTIDPVHGGKWREGMLKHYFERLAELMLYQQGIDEPNSLSIRVLAGRLRDALDREA
jgi:hypothetical protein